MENRIEINGVWYVREDNLPNEISTPETQLRNRLLGGNYSEDELGIYNGPIESEEILIENSDHSIIYSYVFGDNNIDDYIQAVVKFKNSKKEGVNTHWYEEYFDNLAFLKGVLNGDKESWDELIDTFSPNDERGVSLFYYGLKHIEKLNWFEKIR